MAEYGGREDYDDVLGKLGAAEDAVDRLIAKEQRYRGELVDTSKVDAKAAEASERRRRAQQETVEVKRRAKAVESVEVQDINRSTQAIERNAAAREKLNRASVNSRRAVAGAQDPMFGRAFQMHQQGQGTQYAFRRDLPQVGSRRAQAIQEAIAAGFRPSTGARPADRPLTRVSAAERSMVQADTELAEAKRRYAAATRRKSATEEERQGAYDDRKNAADKRRAAKIELESAQSEAAARAQNAAAARTEAAARQRAAATLVTQAKTPGGPYPGQLALPAAGQTARMTTVPAPRLYRSQQVTTPGDPRVMEGGGAVGGRYGSGLTAYDKGVDDQTAVRTRQQLAQATMEAAAAEERARAARIDDYYRQAAISSQQATRAVMQHGVAMGTTSQAMHRHGALTSEFISAAARGETTLKELGNQAVLTAGKFGGWTAAATALYGAAAAIAQVGRGAINANDSVQQLTRVINNVPQGGPAEGAIADLAKEFNVPIDVAGDAVYRMGQRYHDFGDAVEAARASLYSFKTGEVDVETSTRQLISATSGFGLSARELSSRYDQINEAQNVFGVKIGETEAGMAKAAGAFANAGGDFDHLLGLIVAINRATGVTGAEVGTAMARAVTQIRVPKHITKLKDLGVDIDPSDLQGTILDAMRVVREAPANQRDELSNTLASQIFGNQYARQLAPVLRDQTIFNEAMRDTAPEKAKGSAQRELNKVLKEYREQISALGVGLQVLGQRLAEAGAFTPFVGILKLLEGSLDLANGLVGAFNQIPQPLRQAIMLLGQGYILLQGMRRLGVTDKLLGGPLSSIANPERRLQIFAERGLRDARDASYNSVERAGAGLFTAKERADVAKRDVVNFKPQVDAAMRMADDSEERARILTQAERYESQAVSASRKVTQMEAEWLNQRRLAAGLEGQLATVQKMKPDQVPDYLRQQQIPIARELAAPNMRGITYLDDLDQVNRELGRALERDLDAAVAAGATHLGGSTTGDRLVRSLGRGGGAGPLTTSITSQMQAMTGAFVKYSDDLAKKVGGEAATAGRSVRLVERGAIAATALTGRAIGGVEGAARGLRGSGAQLRQLAGSFSLLDKALLGIAGAVILGEVLKNASNKAAAATEAIVREANTLSKERERIKQLREDAKKRGSVGDVALGAGEVLNPLNWDDIIKGDYETPAARNRRLRRTEAEMAERNAETQKRARQNGQPVPFMYSRELIQEIEGDAKDRNEGLISQREFDRRMENHAKEAASIVDGTRRRRQRVKAALAEANRSAGDAAGYQSSLRGLDDAGLQKEMQASGAAVQMGGLGGGNLKRLQQQYKEAQRRFNGDSASDLTNLASARQTYYQTLIGEVNRELQAALLGARSEGERQAAFERARQRYRDAARGVQERIRRERKDATDTDRERRLARQASSPDLPRLQPTPNQLGPTHPFAKDQEDEDRRQRAALQAVIDRTRNERARAELERLRDTPNENLGVTDRVAKTGGVLYGSKLLSKGKGADEDLLSGDHPHAEVRRTRERGARVRDRIKKKDQELTQAERELQAMAYDDRQQGRQIKTDLAVSQTRDQGEQAAIQIRAAQVQVRDAQREFGNKSRQYRQALITLNQARQQQADALLANVEADNALLLARAGSDPAAQARAAVQAAQNTLQAMQRQGADPNQIKQQRAEVINAQNQQAEQQRSEAEQIAGLQSQIAAARASGDPVAAARAAVRAARSARSRARTRVERLQALLDLINANNQMEDALREREQARFDLLASRTEDPLEQTRIDVRRARANLRGARGTERIRARAEYNRARQAHRNQRIDSRLDDINFNLEMDKISNDEAAKQIEALAKIKGISKQKKRELLLQAKRLRDEAAGDYELDIGNIKLPTLYEVRRFVQGGMPGAGQSVTDNRTFNVEISTPEAANAFASNLELTNGTSAKGAARAMKMR
jgi:hypothetical protein